MILLINYMATPTTKPTRNLPIAVIIGRANVGKSSLFNRVIEDSKALVSNVAGTTRTNNEGEVLWRGKNIKIIDTGGQDTAENEFFAEEILAQADSALQLADAIVFVADTQVGILPQELELIKKIRQRFLGKNIPIIFVANKCDKPKYELEIYNQEWLGLGLGSPLAVSAASGRGVGDFLDVLYTALGKKNKRPKILSLVEPKNPLRVALIGKPNVGKSSLFNKLIGEEKVIVSPIAHTTRESFDTTLVYEADKIKHHITFVDTAGIRRKSRVEGGLENQGVHKSLESIERSDIVLLVLDANEALSSQDLQLGGLLERHSRSVIIVLNKWDLTDDVSDAHRQDVKEKIYQHFPHLKFAPIVMVSGKTGYRVHQIFPLLLEVNAARKTIIDSKELDEFFRTIKRLHKPAKGKGTRQPGLLGLSQINAAPPIFELFIKYQTSLHLSYVHFIENKLREQFNFIGAPIVIKLTKMKR
ncbi:MAG: ribosome biogenesis GTPase Der [Candidatus Magasanikbacteria bacterium RIFCSPHIGHO2_01_FULL_41_23]|uniref:GTPase Der n=1 Tax=Candidatus Magasanikbacteria bacterium RIFCSPLOWO2_01_FULL_40_15 TaxID=1798686 RepID=A0A1F6N2G0_9BACT|nr:MAG: ribosome biogenesis GTPase Der [Candidatus Magasanikbacteria bacterium RIFCSPHIGHO2_01_FULL_41_23]OGH66861.1 MAG: ribosome biogenesis GTPase Der [Candidatus Magasanikbacteria bacterium RIFCSPHIGHO2_02_FULL_41_35]OGH74844.1 MAG: ribosome biogenesis GTPase Der [Candidatus Magasanikbacteria bacterium RIFCSPHIGHO2_12_FULL_41_16]OGH78119.1 MAG: ribosome biogenesis GTPase Der [Candidatus Magasanikbacteria bacterium RIFCSPLOWO2_01_FULL_40_15]